mmetsp:Transcript_2011/g.5388  ORF Transcript_2011/g.5388 Transcript_2011/m.5388 type:complete len:315 (+) Transcript_2011:379-1323(+)
MSQCQSAVAHNALNLMKLREVRTVDSLVTEHAVDREVAHWLKRRSRWLRLELVRPPFEHARAHSRRVCAKNVLFSLLEAPVVPVPDGVVSSALVHVSHAREVVGIEGLRQVSLCWPREEEGIVCVTCRVLLRLEKRVEIPERALDIVVRRHLRKSHLDENLAELLAHLEQRVQVPAILATRDVEVVVLELRFPPASRGHHLFGEVCRELLALERKLRAFGHPVRRQLHLFHNLALHVRLEIFLRNRRSIAARLGERGDVLEHDVFDRLNVPLDNRSPFALGGCEPPICHRLSHAVIRDRSSRRLQVGEWNSFRT